jgi:segregation and condensation protein B
MKPPHDMERTDAEGEVLSLELLERVAEALIFASDGPIRPGQIAEVCAEVTGIRPPEDDVVAAVARLSRALEGNGRSLRIETWAGGYRMATEPSVAPFLKAHFSQTQERRLSRSLLETLAILAYRQPVTKPEIDFVRGVDSDYALRRLLELGLIDVVGRSDALGRPLLYGTTAHFLDTFGLADLDELPALREIEELLGDPAFNRERAILLMAKPQGDREGDPEDGEEEAEAGDS